MEPRIVKGFDPAPPGKLPLKKAILDSDFDGCGCGVILLQVYPDLEIEFANSAEVESGKFVNGVNNETVVADLAYIHGCGLWFDHHLSNIPESADGSKFPGRCGNLPSAAEIVYDYYQGITDVSRYKEMIYWLGKFDSGNLSIDEVSKANDFVRIGFAIDRSDNEFNEYFTQFLAKHTWEETMAEPRVQDKLQAAEKDSKRYLDFVKQHATIIENVAFFDNREFVGAIPHHFVLNCLYPDVDGVVMYSKNKSGIKFSMFGNGYKADRRIINFLSIAKVMNPVTSGGHKEGCGFMLLADMSVDTAVNLIKTLLRNFR